MSAKAKAESVSKEPVPTLVMTWTSSNTLHIPPVIVGLPSIVKMRSISIESYWT